MPKKPTYNDVLVELRHLSKPEDLGTDAKLGEVFGLTGPRIHQLRNTAQPMTAKQIAKLVVQARKQAAATAFRGAIKPIVEYYETHMVHTTHGTNHHILPTQKSQKGYHAIFASLRKVLEAKKGVFVFYDSMGRGIYVGKTNDQNLWFEMNDVFNRLRPHNYKGFYVDHPTTGQVFRPTAEVSRQPKLQKVKILETAAFFSAYEVHPLLIKQAEALMIRAFANTLTNKKMETLDPS